jgi:methylthioribose-1-phosphate isomerase
VGTPALWWLDPPAGPAVALLDQTRLPARETVLVCRDVPALVDAIRRLAVRGAPLLGLAGAYGVALAAHLGCDPAGAARQLSGARPTAVNLGWGARRALAAYQAALRDADRHGKRADGARAPAAPEAAAGTAAARAAVTRAAVTRDAVVPAAGAAAALAEARAIEAEDAAASREIARLGLDLVPDGARVLTHCNTGALVSAGEGTAFAIILAAHRAGRLARLWVDETRPLLQGARLTAYEAARAGISHAVLPDGAAASLMAAGQVDLVLTGADRIAADGSVANKVGTYGLAVLARHHGVPFVVAAPVSTVDFATASGRAIVVEHRAAAEVTSFAGTAVAPPGAGAYNPAFDVTPPGLVTALVTERGVVRPVTAGKLRLLEAGDSGAGDPTGTAMEA